jgi:flagellar biosynthesis/type III secretory pathway protein FliH
MSDDLVGLVVGGLFGGVLGHGVGYNQGYNAGYQRAKWEMEQQMASMRMEFMDNVKQLQAQVNEVARSGSNRDQRMVRIEQSVGSILAVLQAEAQR